MNIVKTYGNYIKKYAGTHPAVSHKMIDIGLHLEQFRTEHFAEKTMPKAYQKLNTLGVKNTLHALEYPESTVWCNLFAPVEIFQCFGLSALSMECLSSFLSGFTCEDYFIDRAESRGIASTLCSYHKDFIGAVDSGIISPARLGVTTSMICDGNINTFRYVSRHTDLDTYVIDVPDSCSPEAVEYVTMQLKELIQKLEALTGKRLSMDDLSETLARENQSKAYYKEFLKLQAERYYPSTLTLQMYMLFATHLNIGTPETLDLFRSFAEDIKQYPKYDGTRIVWVHLLPFYQETLKHYFNLNRDYQIQCTEMNLDYMDELDTTHPLEALATKMLNNLYNGPYEKKANMVVKLAKEMHADGVINFCHWGCKQSAGGVFQLREALKAAETLAAEGINVRVINVCSIKPLDEETILAAARECGKIVTCEEHSIIGGLGEAVCSYLAETCPVPVKRIGVNDKFGCSGTAAEVLKAYGLSAEHIVEVTKAFLNR